MVSCLGKLHEKEQERILSAGPTIYSTVTPAPPQYTWTGCLCIQKMEVLRKSFFFFFFYPHFFIGAPLIPPHCHPPLPLAQSFFNFLIFFTPIFL